MTLAVGARVRVCFDRATKRPSELEITQYDGKIGRVVQAHEPTRGRPKHINVRFENEDWGAWFSSDELELLVAVQP